MAKHLCERLQRGIEYADSQDMWKSSNQDEQTSRTIVLSGGVASNVRMRSSIEKVRVTKNCNFDLRLIAKFRLLLTGNQL